MNVRSVKNCFKHEYYKHRKQHKQLLYYVLFTLLRRTKKTSVVMCFNVKQEEVQDLYSIAYHV